MSNQDSASRSGDAEGGLFNPGGRLMLARRSIQSGVLVPLLLAVLVINTVNADEIRGELVSFSCALAIDAVLTKLDEEPRNLVIEQALSEIDDRNGQFVCIPVSTDELQVRLQSTDMSNSENRLLFILDAETYEIRKTLFGR